MNMMSRLNLRPKALRLSAGFSLMELLIVMVIIGLLAALAIPLYLGRADAAKIQKAEADFATIALALSMYKLDNAMLPTTEQGLGALIQKTTLPPVPSRFKPSGYLRELPLDPWGKPYRYLTPGKDGVAEYSLYSLGANGKQGGSGVDADLYH